MQISLGVTPWGGGALTLEHYRVVLASREFWAAFRVGAIISLTATALACTLGPALAVGVQRLWEVHRLFTQESQQGRGKGVHTR